MDKAKTNYVVDIILGISFIVTAITGLLIFLFLPGGVRQGRFQEFLGITKGAWSALHNWAGIIMILLSLLHFILHWNWLVNMTRVFLRGKKD